LSLPTLQVIISRPFFTVPPSLFSNVAASNSFFAAGQGHADRRTADIVTIFGGTVFPHAPAEDAPQAAAAPATGYAELAQAPARHGEAAGGCSGGIMAHDIVFLLGDLNYRIEGSKAEIQALVAAGDWATLQSRDQV
jgi:hypothetical protein